LKSAILAKVMPHLKVGAQKWMVLGPAGWFKNARNRPARPDAAGVGEDMRRRAGLGRQGGRAKGLFFVFVFVGRLLFSGGIFG
jgi:hypothetical protein